MILCRRSSTPSRLGNMPNDRLPSILVRSTAQLSTINNSNPIIQSSRNSKSRTSHSKPRFRAVTNQVPPPFPMRSRCYPEQLTVPLARRSFRSSLHDFDGIVYVADNTDSESISTSKEELENLLGDETISKPILGLILKSNASGIPNEKKLVQELGIAEKVGEKVWNLSCIPSQ